MKIAILSDTHGLLRPSLFRHLEGVDRILHAGDVGPASLLDELAAVAPITAVWGNTDGFEVRARVPEVARICCGNHEVVVVHGHQFGIPTPMALAERFPEAGLIAFGHTHIPTVERIGDVLTVNPGSCGARRMELSPTMVLADVAAGEIQTRLVEVEDG